MHKPSPEVRNLFTTYLQKTLRPENALEFSGNFVLDLINALGDKLDAQTPLRADWQEFAPFLFILELNALLAKYKELGFDALNDTEKTLLADTHVMLGTIISSSLDTAGSGELTEERFQIPVTVAQDLQFMVAHGSLPII